MFGDNALWIAAAVWVKSLTGSTSMTGLLILTMAAPQLLGPLAGVLVDRFRRRTVLIVANCLCAATVLSLLLVDGHRLWLIFLVMGVLGAASTVLSSGGSALLATILPDDLLPTGNSVLRGTREGLRLIAPLTGASLFAAFGSSAVVILDGATFVAAGGTLVVMRVHESPGVKSDRRWRTEAAAGARHIARTAALRQIVLSYGLSSITLGLSEGVLYAVVDDGLHRPPDFVGVLTVAMGAGGILGSLVAPTVIRRLGETELTAGGMLILCLGLPLQAAPWLPSVLVGELAFGVSLPCITIGVFSLLQRSTPNHLQGRVYSACEMLNGIPQITAIGVGAMLLAVVDYRILLALMTANVALAAAYLLTRRPQQAGQAHLPTQHGHDPAPAPLLATAEDTEGRAC
ncbi:MFS transporter [Catenulispora sp. NL8]|uniref:MFS transporter n=2 Tax=Catenulispora pinistramenti TaxID=2705254 RepID=A0ABS5KP19_9ACTN|nr:MFS transporter [Catenulispora pinistramenti]